MEPRNDESKKSRTSGTDAKKTRFQIVRLEERIAPHHRLGHYNGRPCRPPRCFYH